MKKPTLYLMLGYPGAGKTTTARVIHEITGAVHVWEDQVRLERFQTPTFSVDENDELHTLLNNHTEELLREGHSVIYDTSFNRHEDRERMYAIANESGARTVLIWVEVPIEIARERATVDAASQSTRVLATVLGDMEHETFERLTSKLEPPRPEEPFIRVDGTRVSRGYISELLQAA